MPSRQTWEYSYQTLSDITGMSEEALRQHKRRGSFDPSSLWSVLLFVIHHTPKFQNVIIAAISMNGKRLFEAPDVAERFRQQRRKRDADNKQAFEDGSDPSAATDRG